jgi:(R,R)-butanediol dehydrogenase / meso-butanediol dehydrogenase / diacetyl reductase
VRAAVYYGNRDLRLESVPAPEPGPGDVKLRVLYNGICGSDLHEYYDGPITTRTTPHPLTGVLNPIIMGHELCGEVVALGSGVEDLAMGDLIAVDPLESCGHCVWCQTGQYPHCPLVALHGYNRRGGGLAEYTVVRRSMAHRLHPSLSALQGALIEPLSVAWNTANRCRLESGQVAAIHGAGPIGIGVYLTLRRRGVDSIIFDPSPVRRAVLQGLGARSVFDPTACDAITVVRDLTGGTAVVVAIHHAPVVIPPFDLLMPEVYLTGVAMSANAFPSVIEEAARGAYPLDGWVETIPFDGLIEQGMERLRRQEGLKILVEVKQ